MQTKLSSKHAQSVHTPKQIEQLQYTSVDWTGEAMVSASFQCEPKSVKTP